MWYSEMKSIDVSSLFLCTENENDTGDKIEKISEEKAQVSECPTVQI